MPGYWPASIRFFSASPFGPPAMSTSVGTQSSAANISFLIVPGLMTPGQRTTSGARIDRKSTRLNSSHVSTSYAVLCAEEKDGDAQRSGMWRWRRDHDD